MTIGKEEAGAQAAEQAQAPACICIWAIARFPYLARAAALVVIALIAAAAYNAANPLGIRWTLSPDGRVGLPRAFESRLQQISAAEALALFRGGDAIFVDSRDEKDFEEDHVPRAINLPMRKWAQLEKGATARLPKDAKLVLYCYGGACGLSTRMGKRLLELGYQHPLVLRRGWAEWTEAGLPTVQKPQGKPK
jgi:rhodanese-related sulfurtransferase